MTVLVIALVIGFMAFIVGMFFLGSDDEDNKFYGVIVLLAAAAILCGCFFAIGTGRTCGENFLEIGEVYEMTPVSLEAKPALVALRLPAVGSKTFFFEARTSSNVNSGTRYVKVEKGSDGKKELVPFDSGK